MPKTASAKPCDGVLGAVSLNEPVLGTVFFEAFVFVAVLGAAVEVEALVFVVEALVFTELVFDLGTLVEMSAGSKSEGAVIIFS